MSATVGGLCHGAERLIRGAAEVTIQDLGSLGEFVAAIATVATLLYLAIQIRRSNATSRTESRQTIINTFYESNWDFASRTEMRRIVMGGLADFDGLTNDEKVAFDSLMMRYAGNVYNALLLRRENMLDDESFNIIAETFVSCISEAGGRQWWESVKEQPQIAPTAREYLEARLRDPTSLPTGFLETHPHWIPESS